jgi:hypothetical protein
MEDAFIMRDSRANHDTRGRWGVVIDNYSCPNCGTYVEIEFELVKPIIIVNGE